MKAPINRSVVETVKTVIIAVLITGIVAFVGGIKYHQVRAGHYRPHRQRREGRQEPNVKTLAPPRTERPEQPVLAAQVPSVPEIPPAAPEPAPATDIEAEAKSFIYHHESGNDPTAINQIGCRGLRQACPGSKLPCAGHDYACQDAWFTNYMVERYGSWTAAKAHWLSRVPINGADVGHWW